ncbi:phage tail protein [Flavobacterium pectinovorum]|jgi:microcystin-dependent protein|uniref:Phage tail protein n=1 Tax=Flavobacterium pectinovorum TaxID=29533 RepID=A0A502EW88_9FLAO|nr:tail fiber protein [Flavobacterium pectinovorum]TPG40840.1 phage tail protein [Flavobacterium pectinovorum]
MEGTIGEIRLFAGNFAPRNWSYCNGALVAIQSNTALFSILGTYYGGNGTTSFGLPDLRGRVALGAGLGPGLSDYSIGDIAGSSSITLTTAEIPPHTHISSANVVVSAYSDEGDVNTPNGNVLAAKTGMFSSGGADTSLKPIPYPVAVSLAGNNQPLQLNQPSIGMNYIICMYGAFPYRN